MAGAHLDGVQGGPGINDNGSGSASLLETAIQLKKFEKKLNNKVRFAWWGAEELGLLGSTHYVNDLVATAPAALDDIATYLNYDMVGSPNFRIGVYDADESSEPPAHRCPPGRSRPRTPTGPTSTRSTNPWSTRRSPAARTTRRSSSTASPRGSVQRERRPQDPGGGGVVRRRGRRLLRPQLPLPGDSYDNVSRIAVDVISDAMAHMMISLGKSTRPIDTPSGVDRAEGPTYTTCDRRRYRTGRLPALTGGVLLRPGLVQNQRIPSRPG